MKLIRRWWRLHGTKIIGYVTVALAFLATADQELVGDLLGPNFPRWALLVSGLLTALRGHTNKLPQDNQEQSQ